MNALARLLRRNGFNPVDAREVAGDDLILGNVDPGQALQVIGIGSGTTWHLIFQGEQTADLTGFAVQSEVEQALNDLPNVEDGEITCWTYGPGNAYRFHFHGRYADLDGQEPLTVGSDEDRPAIHHIDLKGATSGTWNIHPGVGSGMSGLAYNISAAALQTALRGWGAYGNYYMPDAVVVGPNGGPFDVTHGPNDIGTGFSDIQYDGGSLAGGSGAATITRTQIGISVSREGYTIPAIEGDQEVAFDWEGMLHIQRRMGRAFIGGYLFDGDSLDGSSPLFTLPESFQMTEALRDTQNYDSIPCLVNGGWGYAQFYDADDGNGWACRAIIDATGAAIDQHGVFQFAGASWPVD